MTDRLTIRRPDDWHVHLREGAMLRAVAGATARQFARAIIMPNLTPPVTDIAAAQAYRARIMTAVTAAAGPDHGFTPLMTCYLTDHSDAAEIARGYENGTFAACKLYPAHATTNSAHGVTDILALRDVLETMQRIGMPLLIHGEVTDRAIDIFDREAVFLDRVLTPLIAAYPALRIVLEHITTAEAAAFVAEADHPIAATITPQHLIINRNAIFDGGLRPHAYCLPVAKREAHRLAVRRAAVSGSARFFLGTDSAPHVVGAKESGCGCAGIYNAPFALEAYLQVFDEEGALDRFEGFVSEHGARFYGLPLNEGTVTLVRAPVDVPATTGTGETAVVPFLAGQTLAWRMAD
ncbi:MULTISPECIES: dihydroorotase [unclassified Sphingomonas]|jgi:dihydroorotase|uniref:dihydroorotase n=1 Tax=unclassified Sphingomonas TaxID=196159 RepID=UPI000E10C954|nr:dihydroorotase [Sphingomonas sp. FARSPH]AXJ95496.1 dihydroorotase [Sphingomonas sp. FARSPH]